MRLGTAQAADHPMFHWWSPGSEPFLNSWSCTCTETDFDNVSRMSSPPTNFHLSDGDPQAVCERAVNLCPPPRLPPFEAEHPVMPVAATPVSALLPNKNPCKAGAHLLVDRVKLATVLSERLFGTPATDSFSATVASLEHTGQLRCFVADLLRTTDIGSEFAIRAFTHSWLELPWLKAPPTQAPEQASAMIESTLRFAQDVIQADQGLLELFTSKEVFTSSALSDIYPSEMPIPPGEFVKITLEEENRSGLFSQAAFTQRHSPYHGDPDFTYPVRRGLALHDALLCDMIPQPPLNVDAVQPSFDFSTRRRRWEAEINRPRCFDCHSHMNPFGYLLENYDTLGRYRELDNGHRLDVSATLPQDSPLAGEYSGPREFFKAAAANSHVQSCVSARWLRYLVSGRASVRSRPSEFANIQAVRAAVEREPNASVAELAGIAASTDTFLRWVDQRP